MNHVVGGSFVRIVAAEIEWSDEQRAHFGHIGIVDGGSVLVSRVVFDDAAVVFYDDAALQPVSELQVDVAQRVRLYNAAERQRRCETYVSELLVRIEQKLDALLQTVPLGKS